MNILWISPILPYPLKNGAKVRVFNLLKPLSKSNSITFISFVDPNEDKKNITF